MVSKQNVIVFCSLDTLTHLSGILSHFEEAEAEHHVGGEKCLSFQAVKIRH